MVQSVPPYPRGMPFGLIHISQAIWTEAMTILGMLQAKLCNMEGYIKSYINRQLVDQDRQVQIWLDAFKSKDHSTAG